MYNCYTTFLVALPLNSLLKDGPQRPGQDLPVLYQSSEQLCIKSSFGTVNSVQTVLKVNRSNFLMKDLMHTENGAHPLKAINNFLRKSVIRQ